MNKTETVKVENGVEYVQTPSATLDNPHLCGQCGRDMGYEWILGPVCGKCCRENHRRVVRGR